MANGVKKRNGVKRRTAPAPAANRQDAISRCGQRARVLREERGLLLDETAKRAKLSAGGLSEVEQGIRWRSIWDSVIRLAQAIGCRPADFFEDKRNSEE